LTGSRTETERCTKRFLLGGRKEFIASIVFFDSGFRPSQEKLKMDTL
jgi:hypothetical protein